MATAVSPLTTAVREVTAWTRIAHTTAPISICSHFPSVLTNRGKVLFSNRIKPRPLGAPVKCYYGGSGGGVVLEIDETNFSQVVLKSERPVLVEFVATWCGPCRLIAPAVQSIAQEYEDKLLVVKVDHDSNPQLIEEYKVYGLPTLIAFRNGAEVPESRREGAITKAKLKDYVDKFLDGLSVQ